MTPTTRPARSGSVLVAAGILLSRLAGLVRTTLTAAVLGTSGPADAFANALRIPNLLQNLLGEGTLSASFIPVYADLLERGERREAGRVAGAVFGLLAVLTGILVLVGMFLADPLTSLIAPGLTPEVRELTVDLVRVVIAGIGFLVLSAWCLGVLNAHRRFFLSYVAPVVWNVAIVAALAAAVLADASPDGIARAMAWGVAIGGALQFAVQLPSVLRYTPASGISLAWANRHVATIRRRFWPALLGRGVVQLSTYVDIMLASLLATGAPAILFYAQTVYILAVSVFAMSIAAAELPELSRLTEEPDELVRRADAGLARVTFFMMFVTAAYVGLGEPIASMLFEWRDFTADDATVVWLVLAAMSIGLPAVGASRLLQNTLYAVGDTKGPARIAAIRVLVTAGAGLVLMFPFDRLGVVDGTIVGSFGGFTPLPTEIREAPGFVRLGTVGLALGLAASAWTEFVLLTRLARRRLPELGSTTAPMVATALPAAVAFALGAALKLVLEPVPSVIGAPIMVAVTGFVYTVMCFRSGVAEADLVLRPIRRLLWGRSR